MTATLREKPIVLLSPSGWLFLSGDTNDFLEVQFGRQPVWDEADRSRAAALIKYRSDHLGEMGSRYLFMAVPEKSVIYQDYMPDEYRARPSTKRPTEMLLEDVLPIVIDAETTLKSGRTLGPLYFRGDTHVCWLGAWLLYRVLAERLAQEGLISRGEILRFDSLTPTVAAYEGDLTSHLTLRDLAWYQTLIERTLPAHGVELAIRLELPVLHRQAQLISPDEFYTKTFSTRETLVYEKPCYKGLTAVVFRDSTSQFLHPWIAQHFRRSVFVWHQGQVYDEVVARERPNVVLHLMAERFATSLSKSPAFIPASGAPQAE